jgi:hypothetical protein
VTRAARGVTLGGIATVYCVHDREKRVVRDPDHVAHLGHVLGITFDPRRHKLQECACCQNLFVTDTDTPRLCGTCSGIATHPLAAELPLPNGVIHG